MKEKVNKLWVTVVDFQLKYRLFILLLLALVTVLSFYSIVTKLTVKTDFFEIYPPKHEYIKLYKEFRGMFGSANVLSIILEKKDGDIYNPATMKKITELTLGILKIKGCNPIQVSSIAHPSVKQVVIDSQGIGLYSLMYEGVPETPAECEKLKKAVYANEGLRGFYVSFDDKSTALYAGFWEEGVDLLYLYNTVKKLVESIEDENHKCYVAGYPMLYAWISHYRPQIYFILSITVLSMIVLLVIYFRKLGGVLIPLVSGAVSAIWGLGFASAVGINIDPLLLVVPILLSARALSHSCQCLERFHQEFLETRDKKAALVKAYSALYPPALLAIITDGLGVLTIAIATIPLMQKLAYFSSFWIISIFIAVVVLNPIIISYWYSPSPDDERLKQKEISLETMTKKTAYTVFTNILYKLSGPRAKWGVGFFVLVLIFGGGAITTRYLKVGDSSAGGAILYADHEYNMAMQKMNNDFAGASQLIVVLEGKKEVLEEKVDYSRFKGRSIMERVGEESGEADQFTVAQGAIKDRNSLRLLEELGIYMKHEVANVGGAISFADLVRKTYRMYHEGSPKWDMVPKSRRDLGQIFFQLSASMRPGEIARFVSLPEYQNATVTAYLRGYNHKSIKEAIAKIKEFQVRIDNDPDARVRLRLAAGILGILAAVNEEVEWSYWAILVVIFFTTFLLCSFTYRSFKAALILLIPLAVSQVACELVMLMLNIDLNIDSLPVTAIGVGIGIDYGIYLMSRLKEECMVQNDFDKARLTALLTTGRVIMFTALTLGIGVGFWMFSVMKFCAEMGLLIFLLMVFNMISALVLIPALSGIFKPVFVKNIGKEVAV